MLPSHPAVSFHDKLYILVYRFKSNVIMEGTGFSCRITGHKRNATQPTNPSAPTTTTTTPKPIVCPAPNPSLCACGRLKSGGNEASDGHADDVVFINNRLDFQTNPRSRGVADLLTGDVSKDRSVGPQC